MEEKKERDGKIGFFDQLRRSNIRFNPRPWCNNSFNEPEETVIFSDEDLDRLHVEVVKKVDELLASLDERNRVSEDETNTIMIEE